MLLDTGVIPVVVGVLQVQRTESLCFNLDPDPRVSMLRKIKQCEGKPDATAEGKTETLTEAGWGSVMLRVFHPLLVYDAYTFRWLGFDPRETANTREQAFTKVTNVGLISALVFTVWAS